MARRWAIGLILTGVVVLVLTAGVSVGHGDPMPGTPLPFDASFVEVWGFHFQVTAARQSLVIDVAAGVALAGLIALMGGVGLLVYSLIANLRAQRHAPQTGQRTDGTTDP